MVYYMRKTVECNVCKEFVWNEDMLDGLCRFCNDSDKTLERKLDLYKKKAKIRQQLAKAFKSGIYAEGSIPFKLIGICSEEFILHLENSFINRYGRAKESSDIVHVDHIVPLSRARSEWELRKLNHYTNLQWLLRDDNFRKNDKFKLD